jgi:feruloyl esterase
MKFSCFAYCATAGLLALLLSMPAFSQAAKPAVSCESLAKLALPDVTITLAQSYAAGEFKAPARSGGPGQAPGQNPGKGAGQATGRGPGTEQPPAPAFCRVAATLKPTSDSNINIEVWLPLSGWNEKFMGVGGGGWAGRIVYAGSFGGTLGLIEAVQRGYAAASTDAGHDNTKPEESGGRFVVGHPEKAIDYGYRAVHLMTVEGKEITKAFYGAAPKHSYFFGASRGGYEAVTEARRFPEDYDGIAAAWPPNPFVLFNAQQLWANWLIAKDPARLIPQSKYAIIHEAVLKACDELDGVKDGILENPLNCHFDPKVLLCKGADAPACLTAPQVDLLQKTYQGPVNPRTGNVIFPGPAPSEELEEMYSFATGEPRQTPLDMYKYVVFQDPKWDWKTLDWDSDIIKAIKVTSPMLLTDSNLKGFVDHGGKLFLYIGWLNYHNPKQLIDYYNDAVKIVGAGKAANSIRLITMPGTFQDRLFDQVDVIEQWVEKGKAPDQITGTYMADGKVLRTRPLCAYPKVAQYKGTGSTDDARNFVCAEQKSDIKK